jgi:hypothetical protein
MTATTGVSGSSKSGGLLMAAFRAGQTEEITWQEVPFGDLILTVAQDAMKATVAGKSGVRLPATYLETVTICRELGCVAPTQPICDTLFTQARSQLTFVPLVRTASDSMKMASVDFTLRFHDGVEKQLAKVAAADRGLVFGAWKFWILHSRIVERGAVNYGFWDKSTRPPRTIQTVGGQHDASHYDYSQLLQPIKRVARKAATGEAVDLLDYIAKHDRVPAKYLDLYKEAPAVMPVNFDEEPEAVDLLQTLTSAGLDVAPVSGWEKRGRPGFTPQGIMVHHTAGGKKGDAPTLSVCVNGRVDPKNPKNNLAGPLCHIVLARSGKAHVVAANIANHAGPGAQQVLDLVRKDEPITADARVRNYKDTISGNAFFYGIEVENAGVADDPYPDVQITALGNICAALCKAHGWSASRVVHHRQWTARKIDMSYKADLPGIVAQMMDTGMIHFGISFGLEEEEGPEATPVPEPKKPAPKAKKKPAAKPPKGAPRPRKAVANAKKKAPPAAKKPAPKAKKPAPKAKKTVAA